MRRCRPIDIGRRHCCSSPRSASQTATSRQSSPTPLRPRCAAAARAAARSRHPNGARSRRLHRSSTWACRRSEGRPSWPARHPRGHRTGRRRAHPSQRPSGESARRPPGEQHCRRSGDRQCRHGPHDAGLRRDRSSGRYALGAVSQLRTHAKKVCPRASSNSGFAEEGPSVGSIDWSCLFVGLSACAVMYLFTTFSSKEVGNHTPEHQFRRQ